MLGETTQAKEPELAIFAIHRLSLAPVFSSVLRGNELMGDGDGGTENVHAIVDTLWTFVESGPEAWTRRRDIVPAVEGAQVMLNVEPAEMDVGMVAMVN